MYVNLQIRYHDKESTYSKEGILEQNSFLFFWKILWYYFENYFMRLKKKISLVIIFFTKMVFTNILHLYQMELLAKSLDYKYNKDRSHVVLIFHQPINEHN